MADKRAFYGDKVDVWCCGVLTFVAMLGSMPLEKTVPGVTRDGVAAALARARMRERCPRAHSLIVEMLAHDPLARPSAAHMAERLAAVGGVAGSGGGAPAGAGSAQAGSVGDASAAGGSGAGRWPAPSSIVAAAGPLAATAAGEPGAAAGSDVGAGIKRLRSVQSESGPDAQLRRTDFDSDSDSERDLC